MSALVILATLLILSRIISIIIERKTARWPDTGEDTSCDDAYLLSVWRGEAAGGNSRGGGGINANGLGNYDIAHRGSEL